ncbi:MAG TPA: glutamine synthetase family protein [Phototrophicaceae bacterium]|nr:glutamine synthetase family protein [Phototrophicaceae bacterium]
MTTKEAVLTAIEEQQVKFVVLWFTDITGIVKNVTVPAGRIEAVIENGVHFDGSSIEGFARVAESDMMLKPDLDTFAILPWEPAEERTARLICSVITVDGDPFIGDPRNVLIKTLKSAEEMGYSFKTGVELEFFLFRGESDGRIVPLKPYDDASYFDISDNFSQAIRRKMILTLLALGMRVDSAHNEIGSGQHEIDFDYNNALISADQVLTARVALRTVAQQNGLSCTFMPRPSVDLPGSGMHTHQSLHDLHNDTNVFADANHEYGLSETARFFLAGQLYHARAMTAVLAPLINSYKRLAVSFEAPKYVTWAHVNRAGAALIRVPHVAPGAEDHTRIELRCPDPSSNPYLAAAVMLAAGLDGIRQRMPLEEAFEGSLVRQDRSRLRQLETLPVSLSEALECLVQDDVIMAALGPYISDRYVAVKQQELDEYNRQITPWELERYLNRY